MKFTSRIIVITRNYDCYMLYRKGTESNKRRLDLHIIELESHADQVVKRYGCERDKKYIEQNAGDLNAFILEQVYNLIVNRNLFSV